MEIIFMIPDELHPDKQKPLREDFVAGCERVEDADIEAICSAITEVGGEKEFDELFTCGILAAFSFLTVTEGEDMYGTTLQEFMANAWEKTAHRKAIEELLDKLMGGLE